MADFLKRDTPTECLDTTLFKAEALRLGAADVGLAEADSLTAEWPYLQTFLADGAQGAMAYLARAPETRCHPDSLLPDVRTVAVCAFSYFPRPDRHTYHPRIACFAQGEDYHRVIRRFLKQLAAHVTQRHPEARCRGFVDTAPILEKAWAVRAGLGRIGRNNLLQHPRLGSYVFLGLLLTDVPADVYDHVSEDTGNTTATDYPAPGTAADGFPPFPTADTDTPPSALLPGSCLRCRACVDACPTGALSFEGAPRLRADRCLAYATIELRADEQGRKTFPPLRPQAAGAAPLAIFGCDRCQNVCPANRRITAEAFLTNAADTGSLPSFLPEPHPAFIPCPDLAAMTKPDFARLDEVTFQQRFARSAIRRTGPDGLKANLALWR